jgi:IclR family transcriptional regulator, acetate operon repressor
VVDRALSIVELLAKSPTGLALSEIADSLSIPRSATHRLLSDLREDGYVRQDREGGSYALTARIVALGFAYLGAAGVSDKIQPGLDRLAEQTGEVVVLAVIDSGRLVRVAKAMGARRGLLYNPNEGSDVYLATTSNGHAWLSCLSEEEALHLVAKQGFSRDVDGPNAPRTIRGLLSLLAAARKRGFAKVFETFEAGTAAMAAPVRSRDSGVPIGTLSIAGPMVRMTDEIMDRFAPDLIASAASIGEAAADSPIFERIGQRKSHGI